ncbi:hypothetical protein GCM10023310_01260 [Paenibacillus vulneris]
MLFENLICNKDRTFNVIMASGKDLNKCIQEGDAKDEEMGRAMLSDSTIMGDCHSFGLRTILRAASASQGGDGLFRARVQRKAFVGNQREANISGAYRMEGRSP